MNKKELTSTTTSVNPLRFSEDKIIEEIMKFVRYAETDLDAIHNLKIELKVYDDRKTFWQIVRLLLNK